MRLAIVVGALALMTARAAAVPTTPTAPTPGEPGAPVPDLAPPAAPPALPPLPEPPPEPARPIVAFAIRGDSKVKPRTLGYLAHAALGDSITSADVPRLQQALVSSELFKTVTVTLEDAPGEPSPGWIVVVTANDKHSWILAPTAFVLPGNQAFGIGFAENDLGGTDRKLLLYGQIGTQTSLFFGTFLDPAVHGSKLTYRLDLYSYRRSIDEYLNPPDDHTSFAIARSTESTYLGAGALIGWNFLWWLAADLRLRGAYVFFRDPHDAAGKPLAAPEKDGWDFSLQAHLTIDHRHHRYGVTWGSYAQLDLEPSIPGLDSYGYQLLQLRAYHSWRLFEEHELELRGFFDASRHLPLQEDMTLGGVADLRGYNVDQFRGDLRAVFRAEYSVPLFKYRFFAFRAVGFYDLGYIGFYEPRLDSRAYLPNQLDQRYRRSDVGTGLRVYLDNIVLPLVGFDVGYGLEGHAPQVYFEVGLTDF
ncbi:MAG TPA: BamA/TamA family outer membrane protein [Kofleriaceae bacterium]|nr:BamA/TamA family outer membrane protein [Kofleriaceae bacterium]